MRTDQPHAAVWLDIPRGCRLRATFTAGFDIEVMFGRPDDEVNMIFDRSALRRLVEVGSELLAAADPGDGKAPLSAVEGSNS